MLPGGFGENRQATRSAATEGDLQETSRRVTGELLESYWREPPLVRLTLTEIVANRHWLVDRAGQRGAAVIPSQ